jgi:hypothetical protein
VSEREHADWRPDNPEPPRFAPRANDMERADKPTAWQRAYAERKAAQDDPGDADDLGNAPQPSYGPATEPLTDRAKAELLRCAEAFENQAARLREMVAD